jgi:hypothetical protein
MLSRWAFTALMNDWRLPQVAASLLSFMSLSADSAASSIASRLVFEEGLQSAWLYETLSPHVDELVVAGITQSRGPKSDQRDAYGLAEKLRVGNQHPTGNITNS